MTLSALWELRLFARCQREEEAYLQAHNGDQHHLIRSRQRLPGAAAAVALIAWVVYATSWLLFFIWTVWHAPDSGDPPILFTFLNSVSPMAGAVGLAMGGAALLSRYPHKLFAVAAVLSGGSLVAVQFSLLVLAP